ncbi:MAG: glycoside hydrolase family 3 N-terminal domain-containing protein [Candidatus Acidiferrales bacterium]
MKHSSPIPRSVLRKVLARVDAQAPAEEVLQYLLGGLAGVVVDPKSCETPRELLRLTGEIRSMARGPVLLAIEQEGGAQHALPEPFTQWPSAQELGRLDDPARVEFVARGIARELRAVGCNLVFAPALDLHASSRSATTAGRSYGAAPRKVAELGAAFARSLAANGVLACAKHFPGAGRAQLDPHADWPILDVTLEELRQEEFVPFARAIAGGIPSIMAGHILLPWIDPERPAALSPRLIRDLLRRELQFDGAVFAEDLDAPATSKNYPGGSGAVAAFRAGCDIGIFRRDWSGVGPALEATARGLQGGRFPRSEWDASQIRIQRLLAQAGENSEPRPSLDIIGCAEHHTLSRELRARVRRIEESRAAAI